MCPPHSRKLHKGGGQIFAVFLRNADSCVADSYLQGSALLRSKGEFGSNRDFSFFRELHGIPDKVEKNLANPQSVHEKHRHIAGFQSHLEIFIKSAVMEDFHHLHAQFPDIGNRRQNGHLPGFEL
ncbi:hypothetical protein SDC9_206507 [bioreactor metagenome]|uniref:Uncharacterized protein n=1 Tax=bioreactor metagenome TaxID=1076179 RepID=A0A645J6P2_9ZZZZ